MNWVMFYKGLTDFATVDSRRSIISVIIRLDVMFTVTHQRSHIYTMNWLALHQRMMILWLQTTL